MPIQLRLAPAQDAESASLRCHGPGHTEIPNKSGRESAGPPAMPVVPAVRNSRPPYPCTCCRMRPVCSPSCRSLHVAAPPRGSSAGRPLSHSEVGRCDVLALRRGLGIASGAACVRVTVATRPIGKAASFRPLRTADPPLGSFQGGSMASPCASHGRRRTGVSPSRARNTRGVPGSACSGPSTSPPDWAAHGLGNNAGINSDVRRVTARPLERPAPAAGLTARPVIRDRRR